MCARLSYAISSVRLTFTLCFSHPTRRLRMTRLLLFFVCLWPALAFAQDAPPAEGERAERTRIARIDVRGAELESTHSVVLRASGLQVGQEVTLPLDEAFGDAIRGIYALSQFADVRILEEGTSEEGVHLVIEVTETPRLRELNLDGVRRGWREDLRTRIPLLRGSRVAEADLRRTELTVKQFYAEKGFHLAVVRAVQMPALTGTGVDVLVRVDPGRRVKVGDIVFNGNEELSDRQLRRRFKENKGRAWWRFWGPSNYKADKLHEDIQGVVAYYNRRGFLDARVVQDTVIISQGRRPRAFIRVDLHEGPQFHFRNIEWEGNTIYTDEQLSRSLGFQHGDVYNGEQFEQNLYGNRSQSDISSLYYNQGHMRFNVQPAIRIVNGDSIDVTFDVFEGDVYRFRGITIAGNDKTKEHVIRRELFTIPGQNFSREAITESLRRLSQLNYFEAEALQRNPGIDIDDEERTVDLTYTVAEAGGDQLELSGTYGSIGLILQLRVTFNNFSAQNLFKREAWRPLPMGDGQQLSLGIQTSGRAYQSYSISFTEPWFRGRPTPVGFSLSYSNYDYSRFYSNSLFNVGNTDDALRFGTASARAFVRQRLSWPDDKFVGGVGIGYRFYNLNQRYYDLPEGRSNELTFETNLSRNSEDNPIFPRRGSRFDLAVTLAPPIGEFIQYHKWDLRTGWNAPITQRLSVGITGHLGYIGSFTSDDVRFQRYLPGGSPFDTQGLSSFTFGKDIVYMRSYPAQSIGPRREGDPVGGRVLNKYTTELRYLAVQNAQLQAAPYVFADFVNTWDSFTSYNPSQLYRSAGLGVRLFLPILGMLEFAYGYAFDEFEPISRDDDGQSKWRLQFTIGQGFN